jgi:signal transduction histidine kinase
MAVLHRGSSQLAADAERRRIAADLHDGIQQRLVAMMVRLGQLAELIEGDPEGARTLVRRTIGEMDEAIDEMRDVVHGIYPIILDDHGLAAAVEAEAWRAGIPCAIEADGLDRYPRRVENALYFTCREALQNVTKHASNATQVRLELTQRRDYVALLVQDNGPGIAADAPPGLGLLSMRERIEGVGGRLTVAAMRYGGTRVYAVVPQRSSIARPSGHRRRNR